MEQLPWERDGSQQRRGGDAPSPTELASVENPTNCARLPKATHPLEFLLPENTDKKPQFTAENNPNFFLKKPYTVKEATLSSNRGQAGALATSSHSQLDPCYNWKTKPNNFLTTGFSFTSYSHGCLSCLDGRLFEVGPGSP